MCMPSIVLLFSFKPKKGAVSSSFPDFVHWAKIKKINYTCLFPRDAVEILLTTDNWRFSLSLKVKDRKAWHGCAY